MAESPLAKKLRIKPGYRVALLNAPSGYRAQLSPLPERVEVAKTTAGDSDLVHLFVSSKADVDRRVPSAIGALKQGGVLWISYPKRSAKVATDITRDIGWDALRSAGWRPVSQVSIDDTWSALRFRPVTDVKSRK